LQSCQEFHPQKGELLKAAMQRYDIILDKIHHLHSEQAWPEVSGNMKKAKLMQIIADETHIYVQNEEKDAIEATGMPYEFNKLVRLVSKYESNTISCQVKASRPFSMLRLQSQIIRKDRKNSSNKLFAKFCSIQS
jgi:hypothetical protein